MWGVSLLAEELLASREICPMELVSQAVSQSDGGSRIPFDVQVRGAPKGGKQPGSPLKFAKPKQIHHIFT